MQINYICFYVMFQHETKQLQTYTHSYRNLMYLLEDQFWLEDFGECKGMGKCGTCLIEVIKAPNLLMDLQRNKSNTLKKAAVHHQSIRLSCQLFIDHTLQDAILKIYEPY